MRNRNAMLVVTALAAALGIAGWQSRSATADASKKPEYRMAELELRVKSLESQVQSLTAAVDGMRGVRPAAP